MLTPKEIHTRISAQIVAALASPVQAPGAWRESRFPYAQFGLDTPEIEHHGFAIGLPATVPTENDRQQGSTHATTAVNVKWAHRIRAEAGVLDTLAAHEAERELAAAIKATDSNPRLHIVFLGATRQGSRDGLLHVGELLWSVSHHYPLQR